MNEADDRDVVDVLTAQHEQISTMIGQIRANHEDKQQLFHDLVRLLAVHECAEEEVLHPAARRAAFGVEGLVDSLLAEENQAKHRLADLYVKGVYNPAFDELFARFADAIAEHTAREEAEEFVLLRRQFSERQLQHMAESVHLAESVAPTRPHPRAGESVLANILAGPPIAVYDRVRDAIRDVRANAGA